jgi:Stress responsive A/B Barrel Domain
MYSVTRLLDTVEAERERIRAAVRSAAEATPAQYCLVEPTLPGSRNGGDTLIQLRFNSRDQWRSAADDFATALRDPGITQINGATYPGTLTRRGSGTLYRVLLLRVSPDTDPGTIARFEDELSSMPRYISAIRAWQLSHVDQATGTSPWTHVFEQEFADVGGLMGPYLMHPIHWSVVDRWFDPECPDVIIRDRVCHSFCRCDIAIPV